MAKRCAPLLLLSAALAVACAAGDDAAPTSAAPATFTPVPSPTQSPTPTPSPTQLATGTPEPSATPVPKGAFYFFWEPG